MDLKRGFDMKFLRFNSRLLLFQECVSHARLQSFCISPAVLIPEEIAYFTTQQTNIETSSWSRLTDFFV